MLLSVGQFYCAGDNKLIITRTIVFLRRIAADRLIHHERASLATTRLPDVGGDTSHLSLTAH